MREQLCSSESTLSRVTEQQSTSGGERMIIMKMAHHMEYHIMAFYSLREKGKSTCPS